MAGLLTLLSPKCNAIVALCVSTLNEIARARPLKTHFTFGRWALCLGRLKVPPVQTRRSRMEAFDEELPVSVLVSDRGACGHTGSGSGTQQRARGAARCEPKHLPSCAAQTCEASCSRDTHRRQVARSPVDLRLPRAAPG